MHGSESTFVVYHTATGEIVHVHHVTIVPGAAAPGHDDLKSNAVLLAASATGRIAQDLATISVDRSRLRRGLRYYVDITDHELREQPATDA